MTTVYWMSSNSSIRAESVVFQRGGPDGLAHTTEPLWDIRVDGASIGQVDANMVETKETVRKAATKLIDDLEG